MSTIPRILLVVVVVMSMGEVGGLYLHRNSHQQPSIQLNTDVRLTHHKNKITTDWSEVRKDIERQLQDRTHKDDIAPTVLRLAWHSAATFDGRGSPMGGTCGATMRFEPEAGYEDNRGLKEARDALEPVKEKHPEISYSDLWVFASYVAIEFMGGPAIPFTPGREDATSGGANCPPDGRIPEWDDAELTMKAKFARIGMTERELVALMGAHTVGHTNEENSGFPYHQWDTTPLVFDNIYYDFLLRDWWVYDDDNKERPYYRNRSWLMLLSDWLLREDPDLRIVVEEYVKSETVWHGDFAAAFKKLTEMGLETKKL